MFSRYVKLKRFRTSIFCFFCISLLTSCIFDAKLNTPFVSGTIAFNDYASFSNYVDFVASEEDASSKALLFPVMHYADSVAYSVNGIVNYNFPNDIVPFFPWLAYSTFSIEDIFFQISYSTLATPFAYSELSWHSGSRGQFIVSYLYNDFDKRIYSEIKFSAGDNKQVVDEVRNYVYDSIVNIF